MPTQIFQYFVPVGSTSVSITAAFFGAGGVTLDVETTQQAVATSIWESYSTLNTLVQNAANGATLDLTDRKFLFNGSEKVSISNAKSIGISGGVFASGVIPSWTSIGSSAYESGHTFGSGEGTIWIKPHGEIAAKLVSFPAVTKDKEFGASGTSDLDARHDYGLGNMDRFAVLDSGGSAVAPNNASYDGGYLDTVFLGGTFGSAVQSAFDWNETNNQINDTRGCYLNVQASDNRVFIIPIKSAVGSATGVTFNVADGNTTITSGGYVNVSVLGPVSAANLQAGQACLLPVDNKIRYKPRTTLGEVIIGSGTEPIFYIDIASYDYPDTIASPGTSQVYSFHGCEMVTGYAFISTTGGRKKPLCDIRNCTFNYTIGSAVGIICGIVTECIFDQCIYASLYCGPNTEISKNYFGTTYKASNINASGVPDIGYGLAYYDSSGTHQGTGFPVIIDRNFFSNPSSQHGQGVSLYQGTCGNAIVTNNLCMNMPRFLSMSFITPGDETAGIRTDMQPSQCIIKNNVIYESNYGNSQYPWSWNSLDVAGVWDYDAGTTGAFFSDTTIPSGFTHEVSFNTHISTRDTASKINMWSSTQFRIPTRMHNNYLQGVSVPVLDSQFPTTNTDPKPIFRQRHNMFERRCIEDSSVISDDNYMLSNQESVARTSTDAPSFLSASSLRVSDVLTTYGTDGGEIGVRYTSGHPTLNNLRSINNNPSQTWWTSHVPVDVSTLPDQSTLFAGTTGAIVLGQYNGTEITPQFTYLTPGTGFTAPEAAMTPIGVSGDIGYDCTPIARWDVVPWQVPTDEFMVGVVAYHREGIDKVQFALNGGTWVDVTQMTMNLRTNEMEFCVGLNLTSIPNENIEVRARVIPTVGIPRILAGGISGPAGITTGSLHRGNHSMFLLPLGTTGPEFFVSPNGSDSTGLSGGFSAGTRQNPYQTISYAAYYGAGGGVNSTDVGGAIITLLPGGYTLEEGIWPRTSLGMSAGWLTIRSDSGTPSSSTQLTGWSQITHWDKVHLQGLQIVGPTSDEETGDYGTFMGGNTNYLWKDNCVFNGQLVTKFPFHQWTGGQWATDCTAHDVYNKPFGTVITRNCDQTRVLVDAFGSEGLLLNSSVSTLTRMLDERMPGPNGLTYWYQDHHNDVWQGFLFEETLENIIVRDLTATDKVTGQGIFMSGNTELFKDMAFLNCRIDQDWQPTNGVDGWTGWTDPDTNFHINVMIREPMEHCLFIDGQFTTGTIKHGGPGIEGYGNVGTFTSSNCVFKNNLNTATGLYFLTEPDGPGSGGSWTGTWPGTLPWTSPTTPTLLAPDGVTVIYPGTNILYLE